MDSLDFLNICPYEPLLLLSPLDDTLCLHRADESKFLLIGQH